MLVRRRRVFLSDEALQGKLLRWPWIAFIDDSYSLFTDVTRHVPAPTFVGMA